MLTGILQASLVLAARGEADEKRDLICEPRHELHMGLIFRACACTRQMIDSTLLGVSNGTVPY